MDKEICGLTAIGAHYIRHQPALIQNLIGIVATDTLQAVSSPALDESIHQSVVIIIVILAGEVQRHVVVHALMDDANEPLVSVIPVLLAELLGGVTYVLITYPGTATGVVEQVVHGISHGE